MIIFHKIHKGCWAAIIVLFIGGASGCQQPSKESEQQHTQISYSKEWEGMMGLWNMVYYTDGQHSDTLHLAEKEGQLFASFNGDEIVPKLRKNKIEFAVESPAGIFFEGTLMGSRLWGTLKFDQGEFRNQRIRWEGDRIAE